MVKSAKFTRDSIYLASDEFLITPWGGHILLYMYISAIVLLLGTPLRCLCGVFSVFNLIYWSQLWHNFPVSYHVLKNDHLAGCADWKLSSAAPWGNNGVSNIAARGYANSVVTEWHRAYHRYIWPSNWQRQLFLLTCFMSSYDRLICIKRFSLHMLAFVSASYDRRFFSTVS